MTHPPQTHNDCNYSRPVSSGQPPTNRQPGPSGSPAGIDDRYSARKPGDKNGLTGEGPGTAGRGP